MLFVFRPLVWDLRARKTLDWALCSLSPLREADGLATEHKGKKDLLLMEDIGSTPPICTLKEREASAKVSLFNIMVINILSKL